MQGKEKRNLKLSTSSPSLLRQRKRQPEAEFILKGSKSGIAKVNMKKTNYRSLRNE